MSHIDQINFIKEFKEFYIKNSFNKDIDVLEIGSLDVNGNIRNLFNFSKEYVGIDLKKGPNVDLVLNGIDIDKLNKSFDIIISCECFEHAKDWKVIFEKMCQISKENSFIVISVASTGRVEHGTERSGGSARRWQTAGVSKGTLAPEGLARFMAELAQLQKRPEHASGGSKDSPLPGSCNR